MHTLLKTCKCIYCFFFSVISLLLPLRLTLSILCWFESSLSQVDVVVVVLDTCQPSHHFSYFYIISSVCGWLTNCLLISLFTHFALGVGRIIAASATFVIATFSTMRRFEVGRKFSSIWIELIIKIELFW